MIEKIKIIYFFWKIQNKIEGNKAIFKSIQLFFKYKNRLIGNDIVYLIEFQVIYYK